MNIKSRALGALAALLALGTVGAADAADRPYTEGPVLHVASGPTDQQTTATVQRGKLRTLLGDEYIRKLELK
jgi:hypothetical protein